MEEVAPFSAQDALDEEYTDDLTVEIARASTHTLVNHETSLIDAFSGDAISPDTPLTTHMSAKMANQDDWLLQNAPPTVGMMRMMRNIDDIGSPIAWDQEISLINDANTPCKMPVEEEFEIIGQIDGNDVEHASLEDSGNMSPPKSPRKQRVSASFQQLHERDDDDKSDAASEQELDVIIDASHALEDNLEDEIEKSLERVYNDILPPPSASKPPRSPHKHAIHDISAELAALDTENISPLDFSALLNEASVLKSDNDEEIAEILERIYDDPLPPPKSTRPPPSPEKLSPTPATDFAAVIDLDHVNSDVMEDIYKSEENDMKKYEGESMLSMACPHHPSKPNHGIVSDLDVCDATTDTATANDHVQGELSVILEKEEEFFDEFREGNANASLDRVYDDILPPATVPPPDSPNHERDDSNVDLNDNVSGFKVKHIQISESDVGDDETSDHDRNRRK